MSESLSSGVVLWTSLIGSLLALSVAFVLYQRLKRRAQERTELLLKELEELRRRAEGVSQGTSLPPAESAPAEDSAPPGAAQSYDWLDIPAELVEALSHGDCVLFAGNGLGVMAGYPAWSEALGYILERTPLATEERAQLENARRRGRTQAVLEVLLGRRGRTGLIEDLERLYGGLPRSPLSPGLVQLANLPFSAVLTTHWHSLPEHAFADRNPQVVSPGNGGLEKALQRGMFPLVKLFGSLTNPGGLLLTSEEYRRALEDDGMLARFLTSAALSRSHLFLGTGIEVLERYFSSLPPRPTQEVPHFAVVSPTEGIELERERLRAKYGVRLLVQPGVSWSEIDDFVRRLRGLLDLQKSEPRPAIEPTSLVRVKLTDIGAFRSLALDLNERWTILLGNNGVGKSTLLRAIALGLCGDDIRAVAAAPRLLRSGASHGLIEIQVGRENYRTELIRDGDDVRVVCRQLTPLRAGRWVVLGFPPLRGISRRNPSGPAQSGPPRPVVGDLLPVLSGDADERLDDLKQWLVNLDVRSAPEGGISEIEAKRNLQLRDSFFSLLKTFMPGMEIDFGEVDRRTWEVRVRTVDGLVPIEQISMGMSSLFGWLGTLLRRMYEIHAEAEDPERQPALVIIDEIDAHLHPEWQQMLAPTLKKHFPALQIVATTHSPLVVAGMQRQEVLVAYRVEDDPQAIEVVRPPLDFDGMRADQILTSPLFGLATTRSRGVRKDIDRYSELLGMRDKSPEEEAEIAALRERLRPILTVGETPVERKVEQAVHEALEDLSPAVLLSKADPKVQLEIKRQLAQVLGREEEKP